jgi:hypothetical protein
MKIRRLCQSSRRYERGWSEEADAHIQAGSCHANEHHQYKTANDSEHIPGPDAGLNFGCGLLGTFCN